VKKEPESVINISPLRANVATAGITSSPVLARIPSGMNCVMLPLAYRYAAEALGKVAPAEKDTCPCGPSDGTVKEKNTPPPGAVSPGPTIGMTSLPDFRITPPSAMSATCAWLLKENSSTELNCGGTGALSPACTTSLNLNCDWANIV